MVGAGVGADVVAMAAADGGVAVGVVSEPLHAVAAALTITSAQTKAATIARRLTIS
jgi:hypothetical protein